MANRVTVSEVKEIINTSLTDTQISAMITVANLLVTRHVGTCANAAEKKEIERWLAAHFVAVRDPREEELEVDDVVAVFQRGTSGKGLESTDYGQNALAIDCSGGLKDAQRRPAKFTVISESDDD